MIQKIFIWTLIITLFALPFIIFKNPVDVAACFLLAEGEWNRQGINGGYCKRTFLDGGRDCFTNGDCKSGKCVIGTRGKVGEFPDGTVIKVMTLEDVFSSVGRLANNDTTGKCSSTNQETCFSGEMTINEDRSIYNPPICD